MRSLGSLLWTFAVLVVACGDDTNPDGAPTGGTGGAPSQGGAGAAGPGGAGGTNASGGGEGGEGGEGGRCTPLEETCDGTDEDCDGVPDDGACSTPTITDELFLAGSGVDHARGVALDMDGNIYITGALSIGADLGGGASTAVQGYLASYAPDGTHRWSYPLGASSAYNYAQDVAVGSSLVCAAGAFVGPFDFGGGLRVSTGFNDAFVVCLDPSDGGYLWDRVFGAEQSDVAEGIAISGEDHVVVTGSYQTSADFGGGVVSGNANNDAFVAHYGSDGAFQWAQTYPGAGTESGRHVAADADGNIFVVGQISSPIDFGGGVRTPEVVYVPFILSLDADGDYRWDIVQTSGAVINLYGVETQSTGDIVISGEFNGSLELGGEPLLGDSERELQLFAAGFSSMGESQWRYAATGESGSRGFGLAVGSDDQIVLAGSFTGTVTFGDIARTSAGDSDIMAVGLTPNGSYLWDAIYGGSGADEAYAAAVDANRRVAIAGGTWGDLDLGLAQHTNAGELDGLLIILEAPEK